MIPVEQRIVELTTRNWQSTGKVLLVSKLGGILNREYDLSKELKAAKLLQYIQIAMENKINALQHPINGIVWGLVPNNVDVPEDREALIDLFDYSDIRRRRSDGPPSKHPIYDRRIWNAFSAPLTNGRRRFLSLDPDIDHFDVSSDETGPDGTIEIPGSLIIPRGIDAPVNRGAVIAENIKRWCKDNEIDGQSLLRKSIHQKESNLLDMILESISDNELQTVSMNLKIIKKLRGTIVK